jgi:hypothetical protein
MRPFPTTFGQLTGVQGVFSQITERVRAPLSHRFAFVLARLSQTIQGLGQGGHDLALRLRQPSSGHTIML